MRASFLIPQSEAEFQRLIVLEAVKAGWDWMHVESVPGRRGWVTPTQGTLKEWPDLFLCKDDGRMMFIECKAQDGKLGDRQRVVLQALGKIAPCYVFRPSDLAQVMAVLYA